MCSVWYVYSILVFYMKIFFFACLLHVCFYRKFMRLPYYDWTILFVLKLLSFISLFYFF